MKERSTEKTPLVVHVEIDMNDEPCSRMTSHPRDFDGGSPIPVAAGKRAIWQTVCSLSVLYFLAACLMFLHATTTSTAASLDSTASTPLLGTIRTAIPTKTAAAATASTPLSVAFIGNSMIYFNDLPRFLEALSGHQLTQNSCLHGGGSIPSLLSEGNGMHPQFMTKNAELPDILFENQTMYDFGACTVKQLLTGNSTFDTSKWILDMDPHNQHPCIAIPAYRDYLQDVVYNDTTTPPKFDYALINDNTRSPARLETRQDSLENLQSHYVPWLLQTGITPVFLWTHAYHVNSTDTRNMTGLEDVANFTSLTGAGYRAYMDLLQSHLPASQQPRIALVGLAFLTVYEENQEFWYRLFHNADQLHASILGTFLTGCMVHHALFGRLPDRSVAIQDDMSRLWSRARMMQHFWEPPNPMITREEAEYLYGIAERVAVQGHVPDLYMDYQHGEAAVV